MSSLWTPDGERPIRRAQPEPAPAAAEGAPEAAGRPAAGGAETFAGEAASGEEAALAEEMQRLQADLLDAPVEVVIANHAVGLFNLAGLHLSQEPPHLPEAQLAIDALSALVEGLSGRLGPDEPTLRDGLSQMRLAFVQIAAAHRSGEAPTP